MTLLEPGLVSVQPTGREAITENNEAVLKKSVFLFLGLVFSSVFGSLWLPVNIYKTGDRENGMFERAETWQWNVADHITLILLADCKLLNVIFSACSIVPEDL